MTDRWRITVLDDGVKLTGVIEGRDQVETLAQALAPVGWVVVVSPLEPDEVNGSHH